MTRFHTANFTHSYKHTFDHDCSRHTELFVAPQATGAARTSARYLAVLVVQRREKLPHPAGHLVQRAQSDSVIGRDQSSWPISSASWEGTGRACGGVWLGVRAAVNLALVAMLRSTRGRRSAS